MYIPDEAFGVKDELVSSRLTVSHEGMQASKKIELILKQAWALV